MLEIRDYGYFAVLAGSGRPESFVLDREIDPRLGAERSSFDSAEHVRTRAHALGLRFVVAWCEGRPRAACPLDAGLGARLATVGSWTLWELR